MSAGEWAEYTREMKDAKERFAAFEKTLTPGELAQLDQMRAGLFDALAKGELNLEGEL